MTHSTVQENDIEKLVFAWYSLLPFYFVLDKQNYVRNGSFCVTMLLKMEAPYPALKTLPAKNRIYFQGQDRYPLRILVDQRGDQTM